MHELDPYEFDRHTGSYYYPHNRRGWKDWTSIIIAGVALGIAMYYGLDALAQYIVQVLAYDSTDLFLS